MTKLNHIGDTLVEVLIVVVVIGLVLIAAFAASIRSEKSNEQSQEHTTALKIAESQVEQMRHAIGLPNPYTNCSGHPTRDATNTPVGESYDQDQPAPHNPDDCIKRIQWFLHYESDSSVAITGFFDVLTQQAVANFQAANPSTSGDTSGVVGTNTWPVLEAQGFNRTTVFCINNGVQSATNAIENTFTGLANPLPSASADVFTHYTGNCTFTNGVNYYVATDLVGDQYSSTFTVHVRWDSVQARGHDEVTLSYRVE